MAYSFNFFLTLLLTLTMASTVVPRPLTNTKQTLEARLQLDGGSAAAGGGSTDNNDCWDSLFELQSCTTEVIMFFLNGETYLGPNCCRAIHVIEHQCWPSMLGSLGFTPEEGDILCGFCDAASVNTPLLPPPPPSDVLYPITTETISHDFSFP